MKKIIIEIHGEGVEGAVEELASIPGLSLIDSIEESERTRDAIGVIAVVIGIASGIVESINGTMAIAQKLRQWYQDYKQGKKGTKLEKVIIIFPHGQQLILENVTIAQIQQVLQNSERLVLETTTPTEQIATSIQNLSKSE